jgi:hypothetical protein
MNPKIEIEGLREAMEALKRMGGSPQDAKSLNKQVVEEVVEPGARRQVPVRSGRLKASIDSDATAMYGLILAGNKGDVRYAGVIHFGWSTRGLGGGLPGTLKERRKALQSALGRSQGSALGKRSINKAARYSGRVRGGPIAPNPFVYRAIDDRVPAIFKAYEEQLEHRAEIAGLL